VIGDSGSAYVRTKLLDAGARDGVAKGQAAITNDGLVGRVVEVGERSSRLLLVTDLNSRIPVVVEATRQRAILAGDNTETAYLALLAQNARIEIGARIVTSGHGGLLPPGLPIGKVSAVGDGENRVQPLVDFSLLEYVLLADGTMPPLKPMAPDPRPPEPAQ
jgi:rod shape-determining protein MreC